MRQSHSGEVSGAPHEPMISVLERSRVGLTADGEILAISQVDIGRELIANCRFLGASSVAFGEGSHETATECSWIAIGVTVTRDRDVESKLPRLQIDYAHLKCMAIAVIIAGYLRNLGIAACASASAEEDRPFTGWNSASPSEDQALYYVLCGHALPHISWRSRRSHRASIMTASITRVRQANRETSSAILKVSKRASFFERARFGDLGPVVARERGRFAYKTPAALAYKALIDDMADLVNGPVAEADIEPMTPEQRTALLRRAAQVLGAADSGSCAIPNYAWYSHQIGGHEIEQYHSHAFVMLIDQDYATLRASTGDDWISAAQSQRAYLLGALLAIVIAANLRSKGLSARAHTNVSSDLLHTPLIVASGLGELSRIGEVAVNPRLGPRFKSVVVSVDAPLDDPGPVRFGVQEFCSRCEVCANACPAGAIRYGPKVEYNGYQMWKPDVGRCTRYRILNRNGSSCGVCLKVCPYNRRLNRRSARLWLSCALRWPAAAPVLLLLDRLSGRRGQSRRGKWWRDLEMVEGRAVSTPVRAKHRKVRRGGPLREIKLYPPSDHPPPNCVVPYPAKRYPSKTPH